MIVKYRIDKKEAPTGLKGKIGSRGDNGEEGINITDEREIIKQVMNVYSEQIFLVALRQRYPNEIFSENTNYFKNIHIKQSINNAITSWGFRSIMLELRKKYLDDMRNTVGKQPCEQDMNNQNKIIKALQQMMQNELNEWIEVFSRYENGFLFLRNPIYLEKNWETLYSKQDKLRGLPTSPFELLRKREIWLWNELTKEEYMKNTHILKISCNTLDQNCSPTRLMNQDVIYYPSIIKRNDDSYEIITNENK